MSATIFGIPKASVDSITVHIEKGRPLFVNVHTLGGETIEAEVSGFVISAVAISTGGGCVELVHAEELEAVS